MLPLKNVGSKYVLKFFTYFSMHIEWVLFLQLKLLIIFGAVQPAYSCLKSTMETPEQYVKYVQI